MEFISAVIYAALIGLGLRRFVWFRQSVGDYVVGARDYGIVGATLTWRWTRQFLICLVVVAMFFLGLLTMAILSGNELFLLGVLLLEAIPVFFAALTLHILRRPLAESGKLLRENGNWLRKSMGNGIKLFKLESAKVGEMKVLDAIEYLAKFGLNLGISVLNGFYLLLALPVKLTGGAIEVIGRLVESAEKPARWFARLLAGLSLTLLFLTAVAIWDLQYDLGILKDPLVIGLVSLIAMVSITLGIFAGDAFSGGARKSRSPAFYGGFAILLLGTVLASRIFPKISNGVVYIIENGHTAAVRTIRALGLRSDATDDIFVRARFATKIQYQAKSDVLSGKVQWEKIETPEIPINACGVVVRPKDRAEKTGTRRAMVEVYWATPEDPDLVLVDTKIQSGRAETRWVPDDWVEKIDGRCSYSQPLPPQPVASLKPIWLTPQIPVSPPGAAVLPADVAGMVQAAAAKNGAPLDLMTAICVHESGCNLNAPDGRNGEICAMQVKPDTARQFGTEPQSLRNPEVCFDTAARILAKYQADYGMKRTDLVALAYNAGAGTADKYLNVPWGQVPAEALRGVNAQGVPYDAYAYTNAVLGILSRGGGQVFTARTNHSTASIVTVAWVINNRPQPILVCHSRDQEGDCSTIPPGKGWYGSVGAELREGERLTVKDTGGNILRVVTLSDELSSGGKVYI
jgi:hypothetical protein